MHKIQYQWFWKRSVCTVLINCHHIVFIKLCDLKIRIYCLLIPEEILFLCFISFDQKCTDCIKDHRFIVHLIDSFQDSEKIITVFLLLAGKIWNIKGQFFCHHPVFCSKIQHLYLECSELFKKRWLFLITQICFQIEHNRMNSIFKLLFQNFQTFVRIFIACIQIQDHIKQPPGILMTHICLSNLIQYPFFIIHVSTDFCSQVKIITVCQWIFPDRKPVIIIILQNPFGFFYLLSKQINISQHELVYLIEWF